MQTACSLDPQQNLEKAVANIREAAARGAQIICLQELFRSQYFCREENAELFNLAESIPGPSTEVIGKIARELKVVVVASLFERRAAGLYHNTAAVIGTDGELLGMYRKMHIPDDPLYFEKYYFTPGDLGFKNFDTPFGRIGVLVCWDQWYPEGARVTALQGANILFYPTAIGWHPSEKDQYGEAQLDAWRTIQRAHAIANGIYVAAVNRVGYEGPAENGLEFWGSSFVADPFRSGDLAGFPGQGRNSGGGVRPRPHGRGAPQLAFSPRPANRRVRAHSFALAGYGEVKATPASQGFRMPAEWEPHEATWLAWPHEKSDWPGKFAPVPWLYGEIVRHLARVERVRILVERRRSPRIGAAHSEEMSCESGCGGVFRLTRPTEAGRAISVRFS